MAGDGKGAIFLGTFLSDGTSIVVCEDHLPEFLSGTLAALQAAIEETAPLVDDGDQLVVSEGDAAHYAAILTEHDDEVQGLVATGVALDEAMSIVLFKYLELVDPDAVVDVDDDQHLVTDEDVEDIFEAALLDEADSTPSN